MKIKKMTIYRDKQSDKIIIKVERLTRERFKETSKVLHEEYHMDEM